MGKWLEVNTAGVNAYFCVICGKASSSPSDYCPSCGARNDEIIGKAADECAQKRRQKCKKI